MSEDPTRRLPKAPDDGANEILDLVRSIDRRLSALEQSYKELYETVEGRLYDTKPMWEAVLARMDKLESRMDKLESRIDSLETTLHNDIKDMGWFIRDQYTDIIRVQRDLDERIRSLEQRPA